MRKQNSDFKNKNLVSKTDNKRVSANSSDIYKEENNYIIITNTSKEQSASTLNNESLSVDKAKSYIERLESKIQEQAKRLVDMRKYIKLCEKRIKQLNKNEVFPITQSNLSTKNSQKESFEKMCEKYTNLLQDYNDILTGKKEIKAKDKKEESSSEEQISDISEIKKNFNDDYDLKKENKKIKEEYEKAVELLRKETISNEELKNRNIILQQTIENSFIKNKDINKYLTINNLVDFTKLKQESENYRKQLVLSQALVNSLKNEIENIKNEKGNNQLINSNDNFDTKYMQNKSASTVCDTVVINENISLKTKINNQNQIISKLTTEIAKLQSMNQNAEQKMNENIEINSKMNKNIKEIENELNEKTAELNEYQNKFDYFNEYISSIKLSVSNLQNNILEYINIFDKIANDDLNSLLSKNFSENIIILKNQFQRLPKIQKYSLNVNDTQVIDTVKQLLHIIHEEFIIIYEKVFVSNDYFNESNKKIEFLEKKMKKKIDIVNTQKQNVDGLVNENSILLKENDDLKALIQNSNNSNFILNKEKEELSQKYSLIKNEKNLIIHICKSYSKLFVGHKFAEMFQEALNVCETILKLEEEKFQIKDTIKYDSQKDSEDTQKVENTEKSTFEKLQFEFENKIEEKKRKVEEIIKELNSIAYDIKIGKYKILADTDSNKEKTDKSVSNENTPNKKETKLTNEQKSNISSLKETKHKKDVQELAK